MPRESVQDKAVRYLREGRLTVERADQHGGVVVASCRGSEGIYHLGYDVMKKEWRCGCQARGNCAHIIALKLIIVR